MNSRKLSLSCLKSNFLKAVADDSIQIINRRFNS